jgi:3',5'-cyclic AMP phosphodiesterase CpdA
MMSPAGPAGTLCEAVPETKGAVVTTVIAHVSDLHIGAHDPAATTSLAEDVAAARPALTVVTGDCTMRARPREFRQAAALLARLPAPRLVVVGNHDVPLGLVARLLRPYDRYRAYLCADLDPVVGPPGVAALGLNSMPRWRWKSGGVTRRQVAAVVENFAAVATGTVRVLALHHPPFAGGLARIVGRRRLTEALVEARVDLVLAGHTHVPAVGDVELLAGARSHRLVAVVAGTATSRRTRGAARSWTLITVHDRTIVVQVRFQNGCGWRTGPTAVLDRAG